jgi:hypothetical protein
MPLRSYVAVSTAYCIYSFVSSVDSLLREEAFENTVSQTAEISVGLIIIRINWLCGLVVRVPGYRSRGSGFDSHQYPIFWEVVGLERSPLSLVSVIEEKK